jgi:hypothetical protein
MAPEELCKEKERRVRGKPEPHQPLAPATTDSICLVSGSNFPYARICYCLTLLHCSTFCVPQERERESEREEAIRRYLRKKRWGRAGLRCVAGYERQTFSSRHQHLISPLRRPAA